MNGLSHRYKYTQKALLTLECNSCVNYESLNLGEYSFETSKIKMSSYCYKYDKYKNPIGPKNDKVNSVKNELKKAKESYEK